LYSEKNELKDKVKYVEDFSELGKYFDMPIKTYSSGMRSRLGFGLSMAFSFDYYLVDEVTSVGDAKFRQKCADIFNAKRNFSNFIMVSHSLNSLKEYCDCSIFVGRDRRAYFFDDIDEAINIYKSDEGI